LMASLFLGDASLVAKEERSEKHSTDVTNQSSTEMVQQFLSDQQTDDAEAIGLIFRLDNEALPDLVKALRQGKSVERASRALAYLGGPDERKILRKAIAIEGDVDKKWIISSFLAGALVEPVSEEEWDFLETSIKGYKNEARSFSSFSAVLALGTNASPRALRLLQTIGSSDGPSTSDNDTVKGAGQAIRWISRRSAGGVSASAQTGSDPDQIKRTVMENVFFAEGETEHLSIQRIVFTKDRNRALVSVEINRGPRDVHGYDIVLQRNAGTWKIAGVWFSWSA